MDMAQVPVDTAISAETARAAAVPGVAIVVGVDPGGHVCVRLGNDRPVAARLLTGVDRQTLLLPEAVGREVLVVFDGGDPKRPVIVGVLAEAVPGIVEAGSLPSADRARDVLVDGQRVVIEGQEEVVLRCGDGSITIRRDGKIVVQGTHILTRSSGANRIKGACVSIN